MIIIKSGQLELRFYRAVFSSNLPILIQFNFISRIYLIDIIDEELVKLNLIK